MDIIRVRHAFILIIIVIAWYCLSVAGGDCFATSSSNLSSSTASQSTITKTTDNANKSLPTSEKPQVAVGSIFERQLTFLVIGLIGGGLITILVAFVLTVDIRRRIKRIWWNRMAPTIQKCIGSDSRDKVSPYIESFWDFFRTLIATLDAARKHSLKSDGGLFGDCKLHSIKLMIGSPISGHGSAWYYPEWQNQSMNVNSTDGPICELIFALENLINVSPEDMTRKIICVDQEHLPKFVKRLKFESTDHSRTSQMMATDYRKAALSAYKWYKDHGFEMQFSKEDIHSLIMIIEDVCGRKVLVTATTNVAYFEKGHSRKFKCPGFKTRKKRLIRTYEDFFDGLYKVLSPSEEGHQNKD